MLLFSVDFRWGRGNLCDYPTRGDWLAWFPAATLGHGASHFKRDDRLDCSRYDVGRVAFTIILLRQATSSRRVVGLVGVSERHRVRLPFSAHLGGTDLLFEYKLIRYCLGLAIVSYIILIAQQKVSHSSLLPALVAHSILNGTFGAFELDTFGNIWYWFALAAAPLLITLSLLRSS